jgi:hypothetical protein
VSLDFAREAEAVGLLRPDTDRGRRWPKYRPSLARLAGQAGADAGGWADLAGDRRLVEAALADGGDRFSWENMRRGKSANVCAFEVVNPGQKKSRADTTPPDSTFARKPFQPKGLSPVYG